MWDRYAYLFYYLLKVFMLCPKKCKDVLWCPERHVLWEDAKKNPVLCPCSRLMHPAIEEQAQAGSALTSNGL